MRYNGAAGTVCAWIYPVPESEYSMTFDSRCGDRTTDLVNAVVFEWHVMFAKYERRMRCDTHSKRFERKSKRGMGVRFVFIRRMLIAALLIRRCKN